MTAQRVVLTRGQILW